MIRRFALAALAAVIGTVIAPAAIALAGPLSHTTTTSPHDGGTVTTTTTKIGSLGIVNKLGSWPGYPGGGSTTFTLGQRSFTQRGGIYTNGQPSFGGYSFTGPAGTWSWASTGTSSGGQTTFSSPFGSHTFTSP